MSGSFLSHLECSECHQTWTHLELQTVCRDCGAPLFARYDLTAARAKLDREEISARPRGTWRWRELLPVLESSHEVTLGEGDSPLLPAPRLAGSLGLQNLTIKDESRNPTLTFKARGMATAVSKAKELGVREVVLPSAGNAGGAMAAYAARAGMRAHIYMPRDTPPAMIDECRASGAEAVLIDGLISDAAALSASIARREGWFDLSTFKESYRLEGKKIMGYELAESFGWSLPAVIIYPTGGGTGLVGIWKAFSELAALGWLATSHRPRLVSVQAEGCAPIVKAFQAGAAASEPWPNAHTVASGLRVPKSHADRQILRDLRESRGTAVAVSDAAILDSQSELATSEGLLAAPEGAATLAAAQLLVKTGWLSKEAHVVLLNTGSGLKYL